MQDSHITTLTQLKEFGKLDSSYEFQITEKKQRYAWIEETLRKFGYHQLRKKKERTIVRRYIRKVTGFSKAQLNRLIFKHKKCGRLIPNYSSLRRPRFKKKYGPSEITLLAATDLNHSHLSGKATSAILKREYKIFCRQKYATISRISPSYIYVIRHTNHQYNSSPAKWIHKTSPTPVAIGIRAKPDPQGRPGYLRVDTVHSGDLGGEKGLYFINIVDEVTQWEMVAAVEKITEWYLVPVVEELITLFPFKVHEFHSDNGSEYVNHIVAKLMTKLYVRFTKSRARHSNDQALVESKNGSVVRKHFGRNHIPARCAPLFQEFCRCYLNPYLNYHRPCGFAEDYADARGKIKKKYAQWITPYEKFKSLENAAQHLKPGITFDMLDQMAGKKSDNEFAEEMYRAKVELLKKVYPS